MSYSSVYTRLPGVMSACSRGRIVACWTFCSIRMTTSPRAERLREWAASPSPRYPAPERLSAVAGAQDGLFFHRVGAPFMASDYVHFIALDLPRQVRLRLMHHHAGTQLLGHPVHVILIQPQLACDLLVGKIQPHPVQAQHPGAPGWMMPSKDGPREIVKRASASLTAVLLSVRLGRI